jgi:hypothetical protein
VRVRDVFGRLVHHPAKEILGRWNWKAAVLSGAMRGALFFFANLAVSPEAAARALLVDLSFRLPLVGIWGAVTQAFELAEPAWAAALTVMLLVPAVAHAIEFTVHWLAGTPALKAGVALSVGFSAISALFNLFAMRRGVLRVGDDSESLGEDLRRLPAVCVQFVVAGPAAVARAAVRLFAHCRGA